MAEDGGAWRSDVFDNGRNFQPREKSSSPKDSGVPPAMYSSQSFSRSKAFSAIHIISISLRVATFVFTLIGFAVMGSNSGSNSDYSSFLKAVNNSSNAYLLSIDVIVCFYSIVQLGLSVFNLCTGKPVLSTPTTPASTITLLFDQVLAYMLMAGCGAGAGIAAAVRKGESQVLSCDSGFGSFCDKSAASVSMSFFAFFCLGLSAALAYFRMFRLAKS